MANSILWIVIGLISIVGGFIAILNPVIATFAATTIAAWVFIFVGLFQIIAGFREEGFGAKLWSILLGALAVFLGYSILNNPLAGVLALTTLVGIMFLAAGVAKVFLAFSLEDRTYFWLILLSGVLSAVLAFMIFSNFPYSAATVLGLLLGIDLISNGVSVIAVALASRKLKSA